MLRWLAIFLLLTLCLLLTALLSGAALAEGSTQITIGLVLLFHNSNRFCC